MRPRLQVTPIPSDLVGEGKSRKSVKSDCGMWAPVAPAASPRTNSSTAHSNASTSYTRSPIHERQRYSCGPQTLRNQTLTARVLKLDLIADKAAVLSRTVVQAPRYAVGRLGVPIHPAAAARTGPVSHGRNQGASHAPSTRIGRSEQVLQITDIRPRRAGVDEEMCYPNKSAI
jgi:hypothetical protein